MERTLELGLFEYKILVIRHHLSSEFAAPGEMIARGTEFGAHLTTLDSGNGMAYDRTTSDLTATATTNALSIHQTAPSAQSAS